MSGRDRRVSRDRRPLLAEGGLKGLVQGLCGSVADNLVWLGQYAFVLQLKPRTDETDGPEAERSWFRNKVVDKATSHVRDTLVLP